MTRTNNLSNTQFRYQIVFIIHIHGYIWLAEGCLWHLFPRQTCCRHLLTGGMFLLLQRKHCLLNAHKKYADNVGHHLKNY